MVRPISSALVKLEAVDYGDNRVRRTGLSPGLGLGGRSQRCVVGSGWLNLARDDLRGGFMIFPGAALGDLVLGADPRARQGISIRGFCFPSSPPACLEKDLGSSTIDYSQYLVSDRNMIDPRSSMIHGYVDMM
jgi:hypothetical protein